MSTETTLTNWTLPATATEQDKQDRTVRMIREAVNDHAGFDDASVSVFAKGSYPNNTNVRAESDVDVAVQCHEIIYYDQEDPRAGRPLSPYEGRWTPAKLREELTASLSAKFPGQVDTTGSTAIGVNSSSARIDADVVPCFDYRWYPTSGSPVEGIKIIRKSGSSGENYPVQHLEKGIAKNNATSRRFKKTVRILKRAANAMEEDGAHRAVPSFFVESLVYNCPNTIFGRTTWKSVASGAIVHIWESLQGDEPGESYERWREVNNFKYLFHPAQKWTRADGRDFANAAWSYLDLGA